MVVVQSRFRVANGLEAAVRNAFVTRPRLVDLTQGFLGLETFTDAQHPEVFYLITRWVRESVFEGKFQAPKTQRALRTIPLGPHAVKALKEHQARVARKGDDDLVFGNRKGDPMRESKLLTNVLQPAAEAAGLGRVTWHQFRHIHSSLLNDLNVPVKIAQEQLGHASIATTLNIYTHAVDASHRRAIEALERELFVVLDHSGLQTAAGLASAPPASDSVN